MRRRTNTGTWTRAPSLFLDPTVYLNSRVFIYHRTSCPFSFSTIFVKVLTQQLRHNDLFGHNPKNPLLKLYLVEKKNLKRI